MLNGPAAIVLGRKYLNYASRDLPSRNFFILYIVVETVVFYYELLHPGGVDTH